MRTAPFWLCATWFLGSCGAPAPDKPDPGSTDEPTTPPNTQPTTLGDAPEWARGLPFLDGYGLIPGKRTDLLLDGVPQGAVVTYLMSDVGTGDGPCLDVYEEVCSELVDPIVIGATIGDGDGHGDLEYFVEEGEPPRTVFLQAWVLDLETGASAVSNMLERHIQVPAQDVDLVFTEAGDDAGLPAITTGGNSHTGGIAWPDINGDYLPDLFITNSTGRSHYLFLNLGDGTFEDISERVPKVDDIYETAGVLYVDIENDGDQDLIVLTDSHALMNVAVPQEPQGGPNLLFLNDGAGNFTDVADLWGLTHPLGHRTSCGALGDYDRDGLVDLYTCHWAIMSYPEGVQDNYDRLLRNTGTNFVQELSEIDGYGRDGLVAAFIDFDQDLWPDLYVGNVAEHDDPPNEEVQDIFYKNDGGTFTDITATVGMGNGMDAWAAMGTALGDLDNDGDWEFYVTDHWNYPPEPRGNPLYTVLADGTLSDNICREAGICTGYLTWPANFSDFNQDRWVDLMVGTAWPAHDDLLFLNQQDGTFVVHTQEAMVGNATHGGSVADYDSDGDLDYFLFSDISQSYLYRNDLRDSGGWMQLHLEGTTSNRNAIGAVVRAEADGQNMMRMVRGGDSAHSQGQAPVHFGVGDAASAAVEITWPSGTVEDLGNVPRNSFFIVQEGSGLLVEELSGLVSTHDPYTDAIHIEARSNYGGRTSLEVVPLNRTMTYDAHTGLHVLDLISTQTPPAEITVESERGGSWVSPLN